MERITQIKPSSRQLGWQVMGFYGFIHFGLNTYTNQEWGDGTASPSLFLPEQLDCVAWVQTMKAAGMKGAILTCKHHDGFCLWPSKFTDYSVASSPWKNGQGDVVRKFAEACHQENFKFGIYLSPWDRAEASYGTGEAYNDYFANQLTELLTNYGDVFEVWFDGANGESEGKVQPYDWERYYQIIRKLQPEAVIAVCGPDVRWVGNEAGTARENEWSVVPIELRDAEKIAERSQKVDDGKFAKQIASTDEDLGSRKVLANYHGELIWYPAEVNTSIRPGWFYHEAEDELVKPATTLFEIYRKSVGGNCTFLLNIPPNPSGQIATRDVETLKELGQLIEQFDKPLPANIEKQVVSTTNHELYKISCPTPQRLNMILLGEDISRSQLVEAFEIRATINGQLVSIYQGESIGYKRMVEIELITTDYLEIEVLASRAQPKIDKIALYLIEK
ncbi:alpha-L-fucosidase [Vagococcus zengguangii]|nr:alpha-L-fucosidase [Vagococcus zengguangii]